VNVAFFDDVSGDLSARSVSTFSEMQGSFGAAGVALGGPVSFFLGDTLSASGCLEIEVFSYTTISGHAIWSFLFVQGNGRTRQVLPGHLFGLHWGLPLVVVHVRFLPLWKRSYFSTFRCSPLRAHSLFSLRPGRPMALRFARPLSSSRRGSRISWAFVTLPESERWSLFSRRHHSWARAIQYSFLMCSRSFLFSGRRTAGF